MTKKERKLIYISAPLSNIKEANLPAVIEACNEVLNAEGIPYSPHLATIPLRSEKSRKEWLEIDFFLLTKCDEILFLEGWEESLGCMAEWGFAKGRGIPICFEAEKGSCSKNEQLPKKAFEEYDRLDVTPQEESHFEGDHLAWPPVCRKCHRVIETSKEPYQCSGGGVEHCDCPSLKEGGK